MDHKDLVGQSTDNFKSANKIEVQQANVKLNVSNDFQNILQRYDCKKL